MAQQPVRRRRRRRRSHRAGREALSWFTYFFGLGRRAWQWAGLVFIVAVILFFGFGMPIMTPFDSILSYWGHW